MSTPIDTKALRAYVADWPEAWADDCDRVTAACDEIDRLTAELEAARERIRELEREDTDEELERAARNANIEIETYVASHFVRAFLRGRGVRL